MNTLLYCLPTQGAQKKPWHLLQSFCNPGNACSFILNLGRWHVQMCTLDRSVWQQYERIWIWEKPSWKADVQTGRSGHHPGERHKSPGPRQWYVGRRGGTGSQNRDSRRQDAEQNEAAVWCWGRLDGGCHSLRENTGKRCIVQRERVSGLGVRAIMSSTVCITSVGTFRVPLHARGLVECWAVSAEPDWGGHRTSVGGGGNKVNEREGSAEGGCPGRDGLEAGLKSKDRLEPINCKHEWECPQKTCTEEWEQKWAEAGTQSTQSFKSYAGSQGPRGNSQMQEVGQDSPEHHSQAGARGRRVTHPEAILPLDFSGTMIF